MHKRLEEAMIRLAYRTGPAFNLSSGGVSTEYVDVRQLSLDPQFLQGLAAAFADHLQASHEDGGPHCVTWPICGPTFGGIPLAIALALEINLRCLVSPPIVLDRQTPKTHGVATGRFVGLPTGAKSVLITEDVITTGNATMKLVEALREEGVENFQVISVVNREDIILPVPETHLFTLATLRILEARHAAHS